MWRKKKMRRFLPRLARSKTHPNSSTPFNFRFRWVWKGYESELWMGRPMHMELKALICSFGFELRKHPRLTCPQKLWTCHAVGHRHIAHPGVVLLSFWVPPEGSRAGALMQRSLRTCVLVRSSKRSCLLFDTYS